MHLGKSISHALAASTLSVCVSTTAASPGTQPAEPAIPISERVFFARDALSWNSGPPAIVPLRADCPPLPADCPLDRSAISVTDRRGGVALAAFGASRGGALAEPGSQTSSDPGPLPWAAAPAVPPLLSTPTRRTKPRETKLPVLEDPSLRAVGIAMASRPASLSRRPRPFEAKRSASDATRPAIVCKATGQVSKRWTDPLASPCTAESDERPGPEFIMPFANGRVTSLFNQGRRHPAIDLAGALGSPVLSTTSHQTVVFAGWRGGYGNAVITRDVYGWTHLYGHLTRVTSKVGQVLGQGDTLGLLGSTGYSSGPHVHYEVRDAKGRHVNPVTLLFPDRKVAQGYAWRGVRSAPSVALAIVASGAGASKSR